MALNYPPYPAEPRFARIQITFPEFWIRRTRNQPWIYNNSFLKLLFFHTQMIVIPKMRICGLPWWLRQLRNVCLQFRRPGSIPGSGRSPGEGNSNPLRYYCLENPMDGGAWQATLHGVTKRRTWLSDFTFYEDPCSQLFASSSYHLVIGRYHPQSLSGIWQEIWVQNSDF